VPFEDVAEAEQTLGRSGDSTNDPAAPFCRDHTHHRAGPDLSPAVLSPI